MRYKWSVISYLLCTTLIIGAAFCYPKWKKSGTEATLSWDVMGYYLYLPAVFIYQDLKKLGFREDILEKYRPTASFYQAFPYSNGNWVMKYPVGQALLFFPFFVLGSVLAWIGGEPVDGFSPPFQTAISWGSILVALAGLWITRLNLLHYFNEKITGFTLLLLVFATNYLNYSAIDGAHTHIWSFTLYALLIHFSRKWYQAPGWKNSLAIGTLVGLAALTRPTDIISAVIPLLWGLDSWQDRFRFWQQHWQKISLAAVTTLLLGSLQLIYWKYVSGDWLVYSYQDQGFTFSKPHFVNGMFSYRKGWFIYTPLMLFSIAGLISLFRQHRSIFWVTATYTLLNIWIAFSWDIWWYGGSFGQRAMIQGYAVLVFPLAAFLFFIGQKKYRLAFFVPVVAFFTWLNLLQTYQAHFKGILEPEFMTKAYYWRIFGKTDIHPMDKKLLDTDEDFRGRRRDVKPVYRNDFEQMDSTHIVPDPVRPSSKALFLDKEHQFTPAFEIGGDGLAGQQWLRVQAHFYTPQKEWETWRMAQMVVGFYKNSEKIKERAIRIHRFLLPRQWIPVWMDIKIPERDFDTVKIYFWNADSDKMLMIDDLQVEGYHP